MAKAFSKNEQILELAQKTNDPESEKADLEKGLNDITAENDEILKTAREYIDQCPNTGMSSQPLSKSSKTVISSKASSSKVSKSSSQRQRELLIAQQKREEIERQNEATVQLANQKQELEVEQLPEENRKRLAEAHFVELGLQDDLSEYNEDWNEALSRLSGASAAKENQRISEWINNSPVLTIDNNQPEAVVSMALATPIATTTAVTSLQLRDIVDVLTLRPNGTNQAFTTVDVPTTIVSSITAGPTTVEQAVTSLILPDTTVSVPRPSTSAVSQHLPALPSTSSLSHAPQQWIPPRMPTFTMPVNHILPNLSSWTFPNQTVKPTPIFTTVSTRTPPTSVFINPLVLTPVSNVQPTPVTSGGTVYYVPPNR